MPDDTLNSGDELMRRAACAGCAESRLTMSRRAVLGMTAGLFSWAFMPRFAEAAAADDDPRLLVVVLRGGLDGLSAVVPFGDPHYVRMRRGIAIPAASTIRLNGFFGLHPAMPRFGKLYDEGQAAVVHATCVPLRNRSHFDGQDNLENGLPGLTSNSTGWLNRLLTALPAGAPIRSHGAIQIGEAPLILRGPAPVLGWSPTWFNHLEDPHLYMLRTLYRQQDRTMYAALERGLEADRLAEKVDEDDGEISELRKGFRGAGRLVAAPDGPRIAVLSVGGFDTHADQGAADGMLAGVLGELDAGIDDFRKTAGSAWRQTVMVLATEFGRTVRENGDSGTDHGVGTVALLAGGAVNGGRVFGDWPGLAPRDLYEDSDLKPTTDLRAVFKGVLRDHVGVPASVLNATIFPESIGVRPLDNLVRTSPATARSAADFAPARIGSEPPIARYRKGLRVSRLRAL
jgi:uncharacterized protein (DUF1501 family)